MKAMCYIAPAQSEYLRARSGQGPIVGVILSPKVLSRPGAQGIQLRVAPTMGLFLFLRRQGTLASCRSRANPEQRDIEIQALSHPFSTWSRRGQSSTSLSILRRERRGAIDLKKVMT